MKVKRSLGSRIRGWFPQEPLHKSCAADSSAVPKTKTELDKRLSKNGWIANAIIVSVFLGVNALFIRPSYNYHVSVEITVLSLGIFASTLIAVNTVLYWRYKKQILANGRR
jgi:uncharacterized membrane protein YvlD (DUF360 family)